MKTLGGFSRFLILIFTAAILVLSCKKEQSGRLTDEEETQANFASTDADAEASAVFNGLFDDVMGANNIKLETNLQGPIGIGIFGVNGIGTLPTDPNTARTDSLPACAGVTVLHLSSTAFFPVKIITEFSAAGCLCNDGHVRRGRIISVFTNRLSELNAMATTTFENYWVDSIHVEGTHMIKNTTANQNSPLQFTIEANTKLSKPNGNFTEWNSHYVMTKFEGITNYPISQGFKIWPGSATGKARRNDLLVTWRADVTEPLIKRYNCRWISKGTVRVVRGNLSTNSPWIGELDYGFPNNGACDNRAILHVNGRVHEITLR
jgi:hypothetical protein